MASIALFLIGVLSLLLFDPSITAYVYDEPSLKWKFVSFFTHIVSHGNWDHLLGNYIAGAPYLIYLETKLKSTKKFIRLFFIFGASAWTCQLLLTKLSLFKSVGLIGSSGAIFGVIGASLMSYKGPRPIEIAARSLLAFYVITQAQMALISLYWPVGVGYGAHLGGLLAGMTFSLRLHHRLLHRFRQNLSNRSQKRRL